MVSNNTEDPSSKSIQTTSRRRLLANLSGASAVVLAGCSSEEPDTTTPDGGNDSGSGDSNETATTEESTGSPVDPELTNAGDFMVYSKAQWNPYNPKGYPGRSANVLFDPLSQYDPTAGEFIPYALTDWSASTTGITLEIRKGQTWHNGDTVDARDLTTKLQLDRYMELPISDFTSGIQQAGDLTVKIGFEGKANPAIFKHVMLGNRMNVKHELFTDKLQAFKDATTDEEMKQAKQKMLSYTIEEPFGNGPFVPTSLNNQKLTYKTNSDHRAADGINYPKFGQVAVEGAQDIWSSIKGDKIDTGGAFTPKDVRQEFPDHWFTVLLPNWWGMGLAFQFNDPIYSKRPVRQAIAYVINRDQVAQDSGGDSKVGINIPSGIPGTYRGTVNRWLPEEMQKQFNKYKVDPNRATTLLKNAGFTKSNGKWQTPDGSTFTAEVKVPSGWSDWVTGVQSLVGDLNAFGINASTRTVGGSAFGTEIGNANFRVTAWPWASGRPHPFFNFDHLLAGKQAETYWHFPQTVSVPMPVGDPDGSLQEINVDEKVSRLSKTTGEDAMNLIHELAWVVNQTLPILPIQAKTRMLHFSTDDWRVPKKDAEIMQINPPSYWLPRNGKIKAKTE